MTPNSCHAAFTSYLLTCNRLLAIARQSRRSSGFVNMRDDSGAPRLITAAIMRRKLGKIAKSKALGFSGNGPDLYAALPDGWVE